MKKLSFLLLAVLFAFTISSCGGGKTDENNDQDTTNNKDVTEDVNPDHRFDVKQGSMELNMTTMGMTSSTEMYWRDYGKETATITKMDMMGVSTTSHTIIKGDYVYAWNNMTGMGTKIKVDMDNNSQNINYNNLDKEIMDKYNIVEKGTEEVMGKKCKVFAMNYQGVKTTNWVYKGMVLKSESVISGVKTTFEVTKLEEGTEPPAEVFELPENINFKDINEQMEDLNEQNIPVQ